MENLQFCIIYPCYDLGWYLGMALMTRSIVELYWLYVEN
jgi:hypothetical protein